MNKSWNEEYKNKWDERYKEEEYVYGKGPNLFFKEWIEKFKPGSILMPADGEGRNGVFAAMLGWEVISFDLSAEGQSKALQLAATQDVAISYLVGSLDQLTFEPASFDAIGLIYAHFSADQKSLFHQKLNEYLKPGGLIILEAFCKEHLKLKELDPKVGGPAELDMLFSKEEIIADFENYDLLMLGEEGILLNEGKYHVGKGAVVRFVGIKRA
jgi:2-polyprenyl-3-methyl-5-hydroxy-6-metoxy-1,4-benzoquinol methylase